MRPAAAASRRLPAGCLAAGHYFACDEWRLLDVQPSAPLIAHVGEPLRLRVSWAGFSHSTSQAIVHPLRVLLLPAVDEGSPAVVHGTYSAPGGTRSFAIQPTGLTIATAAVGATSVEADLTFRYTENGAEVAVPAEACGAAEAVSQWRFHLFVRDHANTTLYHTNELSVGTFHIPRDGAPLPVTVRLCR